MYAQAAEEVRKPPARVLERVGLVVPTLNAGAQWGPWLDAFQSQSQTPQFCLIMDSESADDTARLAEGRGLEVVSVRRAEFSHGGTRQQAVQHLPECDIVVFLTQDAILQAPDSIGRLVSAFDDPQIGAAYGRQLPRPGSGPFEAHPRLFNYGGESSVRSREDIPRLGIKATFISNSFAAYRREALEQVGGFPVDVIMAEDAYVVAKMLLRGWKVAYRADATVYHSHSYTLLEEFRRYFDTGVFHAREPWIQANFGAAEGEGIRYLASELRCRGGFSPLWGAAVVCRTAAKFAGYRLGRMEKWLPSTVKRGLSMHAGYWAKN